MTRRPMRRLSELLPDAVAALGIADELATATRLRSWEAIVSDLVPAAAGRCELLSVQPPEVVVRADDPATAQELRLQGSVLLGALGAGPDDERPAQLRVVVRRD